MLGERAHDVALGQDAGDAAIGPRHYDGADAPFGEELCGVRQVAAGSIVTTSLPLRDSIALTVMG